jgi:hypothetical protein
MPRKLAQSLDMSSGVITATEIYKQQTATMRRIVCLELQQAQLSRCMPVDGRGKTAQAEKYRQA